MQILPCVLALSLALASCTVAAFVRVPGPTNTGGSGSKTPSSQWILDASVFNTLAYNMSGATGLPTCGDVYYCHSGADVVAAATSAVAGGARRIQARSGRHSYTALAATTFGAAVIDVSNITTVALDTTDPNVPCGDHDGAAEAAAGCKAAWVGAGVRLYDLYKGLDGLGLYFPGGTCPTVAVGGYTLGGGYGMWSRTMGLAVDNVLAVDIVTFTDGVFTMRTVNATADPALFWALLGGGNNNFGVVTRLRVRAFPRPHVVSQWRINIAEPGGKHSVTSCAGTAIPLYQRAITRDWAAALGVPAGAPPGAQPLSITFDQYRSGCAAIVVGVNVSAAALKAAVVADGWLNVSGASADPAEGPSEAAWLPGVASTQGCSSPAACQKIVDTLYPNPTSPSRWVAISSYQYGALDAAEAAALAQTINSAPEHEGTFFVAILDSYGGAINRTGLDAATSMPHHGAMFHVQIMAYLNSSAAAPHDAASAWALSMLSVLDGASARRGEPGPSAYRNYPSPLLPSPNERFFGRRGTLERLRRVKAAVDPEGVFGYTGGIEPLP